MSAKGKFLFLGTGASSGIPMVGCKCPVCISKDPKNKRLRPSALLTILNKKLIIEVGPDFRAQALQYGIDDLDGALITHTHYDHIAGLDELRCFYLLYNKRIPLLASRVSIEELKKRYDYLFTAKKGKGLPAQIDFQALENNRGEIVFQGVPILYNTYFQGQMQVNGFRFGSLAYISDIHQYEETIYEDLKGVETLIVSALRDAHSPVHFTFEEAIAFARRVGAKKTFFMHISHESDHALVEKRFPPDIKLAYDGLELDFEI